MDERSIVGAAIHVIQEIRNRQRCLRIEQFDIDATEVGLHAQQGVGCGWE